ncbi:unnamed protein product [Clavelina lepadiformis]|uniref:Uncharacterized protein n=1 Tax=Clavelina lepadiformis TaxID=159417 RepID=A0ABP0FHV8_CLALP
MTPEHHPVDNQNSTSWLSNIEDKKPPSFEVFLECSEHKVLAFILIKSMLQVDPTKRPSIEEVFNHPLFWNSEEKINFFWGKKEFHIKLENIPTPLKEEKKFPISKCENILDLVKMYKMGVDQADEVDKKDIYWIFHQLTILDNPEMKIDDVDATDSSIEQFMYFYQILLKHDKEFNPQHIVNVCCDEGWNSYANLVKRHFPQVQFPSSSH